MAQTVSDQPSSLSLPRPPITLDEYMELDGAYEVIDGELIEMTPQHIDSSLVTHKLFLSLHSHVSAKKLGYVLMEAVFALDVDKATRWLRGSLVPDIAFVSKARLKEHYADFSEEHAFRVAPDMVIEVISPTDRFSAIMRKVKRYLSYGVLLVVVVDPFNRVVHIHTPDSPDGRSLAEADTLTGAPILPDWSISVKDLLDARPDLD